MIEQSILLKGSPMPFKIRGKKSPLFITLLLVLTLFAGLTAGYFSAHGITENGKFEAFSRKVFQNEVSGSTLTLHYTLAHPEKQGIPRKKASLGTVPTDMKNTYQICSQYEEKLKSFRYSRLSTENQICSSFTTTPKPLWATIIFSRNHLGQVLVFRPSFRYFWRNTLFMKLRISPIISTFSPPSGLTFRVS